MSLMGPPSPPFHQLLSHNDPHAIPPPLPHQMLDYNVPGGKLNRGMAVYDALKAIRGSQVCGAPQPP